MKPVVKLFLENAEGYIFGPGRMELLLAVQELGSLHKAAQKLGMSYRWAWGRINKAEKDLGVVLLARTGVAASGRPKVLTPEARVLLAWYADASARLCETLNEAAATLPEFISQPEPAPRKTRAKTKIPLD